MHGTNRILCLGLLLALAAHGMALGQGDEFVLRIEGPFGDVSSGGDFGARVLLDAALDGVQGWSLGVAHDPAAFELLGAEAGATTLTAQNGNRPDFLVLNATPAGGAGVTLAVVISFTQPITLPAGDGYEILKMQYNVVANPGTEDPCTPLLSDLAFTNALGSPPVTTVLTVDGGSRAPATEDATVTVRCPGSLEITRCEGDEENIYLEWTSGAEPRWDFLFLYRDRELLATLDPTATSYTDLGLEPRTYEYTLVTFLVEDPSNPVLVYTYCQATIIPVTLTSIDPTIGYWLGGEEVTVRGRAFTTKELTTLSFLDGGTELPLEVLEVVSGEELRAVTPRAPRIGLFDLRIANERGSAELAEAFEYGFIRGETNADGQIDLSDGIFVLNWLFLADSPPPLCEDAADASDDGLLDISDGIRIITYLFMGTSPPPPPPYPDPGRDPTRDDFGCLLGA